MSKNSYFVSKKAKLGKNVKIEEYCLIRDVEIGENSLIRSHTIIYNGNRIGNNFQTGHGVLIREDNEIGDNVSIGSHTVVEHHVKIGNNVRIHSNSFIPEYSVIDEGAWIGPQVTFTNAKYPASPFAKKNLVGPHIGKYAKIGAGTVLLPGVRIGKNSLIGAGSVVTKNVPDGKVAAGNPAKIINLTNNLFYNQEQKAYSDQE